MKFLKKKCEQQKIKINTASSGRKMGFASIKIRTKRRMQAEEEEEEGEGWGYAIGWSDRWI